MASTEFPSQSMTPAPSGRVAAPPVTQFTLPAKLYVLFVAFPIFFQAGPLLLSGLRALLLVMLIPLLIKLISGRLGKMVYTDFAFLFYVVWTAISIAVNNPDRLVENVGASSLEFMGGYLVGRTFVRSRYDFIALCKWLAIITALMLPFALYETWTGTSLVLEAIRDLPGITSFNINYQDGRLGLERVQGTFAHPIHFGLYCSVAFSLTFVALRGTIGDVPRYALTLAIGLCTFLALSSGALLALILQLALITWYVVLRHYSWRWNLLFWLGVAAYLTIDLLSNRTPVYVFMSYATFSAHTAYWRLIILDWGLMNIFGSAENNIPPAVMFGIGLNDWVRPYFMFSGSMDNFWLLTGVVYGVPGALALMSGYARAIWKIGRRKFDGDEILLNLRRAWIFTFCGLTFTLFTVHIWTSIFSFVFFIFGAGIWFLTAEAQNAQDPESGADSGEPKDTKSTTTSSRYTRFPSLSGIDPVVQFEQAKQRNR